ncbi:hypothetical protein ACET3X_003925 [Alternaria dauci]|uniref:sphingolipid 4-desaturase n=1 Tax=Alternaria dauci TaxID=48095 RepID=A0ABR3ULW9_9PLEO
MVILVLAGSEGRTFGGLYMVALNTSAITQEGAQPNASLTRVEGGNGEALADVYYLYLRTVCSGSFSNTPDAVIVGRCEGYRKASDRLLRLTMPTDGFNNSPSPIILVPILLNTMVTILAGVRQAVFASLIVSLVSAGLSAVSAIPAIFFPHSKLLAYFNMFWPFLANAFSFVAAILLTVVISGIFSVAGELVDVAGMDLVQGTSVLLIRGGERDVVISQPWGDVGPPPPASAELRVKYSTNSQSSTPPPFTHTRSFCNCFPRLPRMRSSVSTATVPSKEPVPRSFTVKAEKQDEPNVANEHDHFFWTYTEEPHRTRRMAIIKAHPEVTKLCGPEPLTKYVVLFVVSIQVFCAYALRNTPVVSWPFFLTAYIIGATANQNLFLAIHEISHNLAFRSPLANRIFAVFANLPIGIPYSASFRPYHLTHHKSLGVNGLDTDLPTAFEAIFLDSVAGKAFFATFQILFYALRPMFVYALPMTKIHLFNVVVQLAFDYALVRFAGGRALGYLIMSSFLAGSLHPCAGHFIAEHYVFEKPNKDAANPANKIPLPETYSYYGPLNFFTYNVGLHNEHHDFPAIPWTRLRTLNRIAHDFYKDLPQHKSWVYVLWQFIWDKDISLWCRVKREEGGRKVGAGSGWNEEELGSNEKKGPIPGVR